MPKPEKDDNFFEHHDMALAATLALLGYKSEAYLANAIVMWKYDLNKVDDDFIQEVENFRRGQALVEPVSFLMEVRTQRSRVYQLMGHTPNPVQKPQPSSEGTG